MPRRGSGGMSSSTSRAPLRNPPQPVPRAPPPAPAQGNTGSARGGFGAAIVDGIGWGTGTAMAHRAVDAVMGPRVIQHETVASSTPTVAASTASAETARGTGAACASQMKAFEDCLNSYGSDISKCQFYIDMLKECQSSGSSLNV